MHDYIDNATDKKLAEIYALIRDNDADRYEWWNDEEMIAELDKIETDLKSGKDPGFTIEESKAHLKARLKKNG